MNRLFPETEQRPKLLGDVRHERMQQPHDRGQHVIHHRQRGFLLRFVLAENVGLGRFHEPVAVIAPDKIVEPLRDRIELVITIRFFNRVDRFVQSRQHFHSVD